MVDASYVEAETVGKWNGHVEAKPVRKGHCSFCEIGELEQNQCGMKDLNWSNGREFV